MTEVTYYYNSLQGYDTWTNEANAIDNNLATFATSIYKYDGIYFAGTTCDGTNLGTITKVEARVYGYRPASTLLNFATSVGGYPTDAGTAAGWSSYVDVTTDHIWTWATIKAGDEYGYGNVYFSGAGTGTAGVAKVELRVTYTASGGASVVPVIMNQYRQRRS